jgi:hypothetical protein
MLRFRRGDRMRLLTWWLVATGAIVAGFLIWTFVPIVVPILIVVAGLAVVTIAVTSLARVIERQGLNSRVDPGEKAPERPRATPRRRSQLPD